MELNLCYLLRPEKFTDKSIYIDGRDPGWDPDLDFKEFERHVPLSAISTKIDEIISRHEGGKSKKNKDDAELALVLHETLGLSRREATDPGLWSYLCCYCFPDYVRWRWNYEKGMKEPAGGPERFVGGHIRSSARDRNTFHNLWWAVEVTYASGLNLDYTRMLLHSQNVFLVLFRNEFIRLPVMLKALLDVIFTEWPTWKTEGRPMPASGNLDKDVRTTFLKRVNIAGSTVAFDALDYDELKELFNKIKDDILASKQSSD